MATVPRTPSHPGTGATLAAEPRRVCPSTAARPKLVVVPVFSLAVPSPDPLSRVLVGIPIELSVDTLGHTLAHGAHTYRCTVGGSKARAAAAPGECGRGGRGRRQAMRLSGLRPARTGVRQEGAHGQGLAGQGERGPGQHVLVADLSAYWITNGISSEQYLELRIFALANQSGGQINSVRHGA